MKMQLKLVHLLLAFLFLPFSLQAASMDEAIQGAVEELSATILANQAGKQFVISVVNQHTQKPDQISAEIETTLYFVLEKAFPQIKSVLLSESTAGISSTGTIFVNGAYDKKGSQTTVNIRLLEGLHSGELLGQARAEFLSDEIKEKALVAILDLEAKGLTLGQRKIYSEIFRSRLNDIGAFELASSAEVDKMDPDAIQEATGCTRDECATVIGQQLGVDRVISTSLIRRSEGEFFLTAKLINIQDDSIIRSANVNYSGDVNNMDDAFKELAQKIANVRIITRKREGAKEARLLAVFPLRSSATIQDETEGLSMRIREELLKSERYDLVEQNELEAAFSKLGYKENSCNKLSCALEIADELSADRAIIGTVKRIAGKYWLINASLVDVPSRETIRNESIRSKGNYFDLLDAGMSDLVSRLLEPVKEKPKPIIIPMKDPEPVIIPEPVVEPEPIQEPEPVEDYDRPTPILEEPEQEKVYSGEFAEFSIGVPISYSVSEITKTCDNNACTETSYEMETSGSPTGFSLHWSKGVDDSTRVGMSIIQASQMVKQKGSTTELELYHVGAELDLTYIKRNGVLFGIGLGLQSTNILCDTCFFEPSVGVSIPLKFGFVGDGLGFQLAYHMMTGNTKLSYTISGTKHEETYTWSAQMLQGSVVFLF